MSVKEAMKQEEDAKQQLVWLAQAMLDEELSYFEGASRVLKIKNKIAGIVESDEDFNAFMVIESETDHLPLKQQNHLWSKETLSTLAPEFIKTEQWARTFAPQACKNIIARFGSS